MTKEILPEILVSGRPYEFVKKYPSFLLFRDKEIKNIRTCVHWTDTGIIPLGSEEKFLVNRDTSNYGQERERKRWFRWNISHSKASAKNILKKAYV